MGRTSLEKSDPSSDYKLVSQEEGVGVQPIENSRKNWRCFPAERRTFVSSELLPSDQTLIKTGGNALQAVDRRLLANTKENTVMAVSVPWNVQGGENILVVVPNQPGRVVSVVVPYGLTTGQTFLVEIPPPNVVMGVPAKEGDESIHNVVHGEDISATVPSAPIREQHDLLLQEGGAVETGVPHLQPSSKTPTLV